VRLLVATRSPHKLAEIRRILAHVPHLELVDPLQVGLPELPEEEGIEVFDTFEDNAAAKARWFRERSGMPVLADDSGLAVDALGGEPGVRSKRFAPEQRPGEGVDQANNRYLLERLGEVEGEARSARFVCVAVLDPGPGPDGAPLVIRGEAHGSILPEAVGEGGFGYDPLFLDPESGRAFAQLTEEEKDARSHRGRAFREMARRMQS